MCDTGLRSKIRPSLRPGTPGDQEDSDSGASWKDAIPIVLAGYPRPTKPTFRGWQGVVPTQHPLAWVPGRGVLVSKHGPMNEGKLV